jgi:hypothetical protein
LTDPFDLLRDDLIRAESQAHRAVQRGWLRPRLRKPSRPVALALAVCVVGGSAATAAIVARGGASPATVLMLEVIGRTYTEPACSRVPTAERPNLSDAVPYAAITRVLPELAAPPATPAPPRVVALARASATGPVLARTVRVVTFANGAQILLFVSRGAGPGTVTDPKACLGAQLAALREFRPRPTPQLRRVVARMLKTWPADLPRMQDLWLMVLRGPVGLGDLRGESSVPVKSRQGRLRAGVEGSANPCQQIGTRGCSKNLYYGIAGPGVAYVRVSSRSAKSGAHPPIAVIDDVFAFVLTVADGRDAVVQQLDAHGRVVGATPLP